MADARGMSAWLRLRDQWLQATASEHTRRAYARASAEWLAHLEQAGVSPGEASGAEARSWQRALRAKGLAAASVNCRLAAASSLCEFAMRESAALGPAENPLLQVRRQRVQPYGHANVLPDADLRLLFDYLASRAGSQRGARNQALLLVYFLTGARAAEVVRMSWAALRPHRSEPGRWMWAWQGKGGKSGWVPLPARAWEALEHYRALAPNGDLVFAPLQDHGTGNLLGAPGGLKRRRAHISESNARRIFRQSLRAAGVERWELYRLHDLRHTFAHLYYRQTHDLDGLRALLHHGSLQTTDIYVRSLDDPAGEQGEAVWSALGSS